MKKIKRRIRNLTEIIFDPTVRILPGQIAFFLILSIFPLLMLVGYIASFFDISMSSLTSLIDSSLPKEIASIIIEVVSGRSFDSTIGISMLTGFILASNGSHAIVLASNTLYEFPHDTFIKRRIKSILLIVMLVILFVFIIIVLAYGSVLAKMISEFLSIKIFSDNIYKLFVVLRWPIAMILMFFTIKLIYVIAPDWHILSRNTTRGALFTTIGWTIATAIFSFYVSHFANYDIFYGSLSNIVVLMIWVYVLSYILVIGIAINVKDYHDDEKVEIEE